MSELDRVRCSTSSKVNAEIEKKIVSQIQKYSGQPEEEITKRIVVLEKEWDIERWLELNASLLAFIGVLLGAFLSIYWLWLPGLVLPFLALHAIQGWCPPVPIMRRLNVRTRREIDWEKFSLKILRGDFKNLNSITDPAGIFNLVKKNT